MKRTCTKLYVVSGDKKFFVFKDGPRRFPYMLGIGEVTFHSKELWRTEKKMTDFF